MTSSNINDSNNPPIDYNYSRVLDVHIWSNYPEVNEFISLIYNAYFSNQNGKKSIAKKHIKLVLLDLYVAWLDDPDHGLEFCVTFLRRRRFCRLRVGVLSSVPSLIDEKSPKAFTIVSSFGEKPLTCPSKAFRIALK